MENWNMLSEQRERMVWARQMANDVGGFQFMDNSTSAIINDLKFDVAKQVRSMIIILAGFNIGMAVVLAFIIFRNCYKGARRSDPAFETSEIFPFVLSIGIAIQGIVFVVSQTKGLEGLLILGCTSISQAMFPALFIVPYIQLVFGIETTVQALRRRPFERRSRWVIFACLIVVIAGTVGMYVVTRFIRPPDLCYASLFWFVQTWRFESFILLTTISCILVIGAIIVFIRLHRDPSIGIIERTAASRMVYYMILGAVINGLMAPFFFSISSQNPLALTDIQLDLNMVASVASNVSGIIFGVLYLFLRSRKMQKIGPLGHVELNGPRKEKSIESWPGTDIFNTQIEQPVSPARIFESRASTRMSEAISPTAEITNGKGRSLEAIHTANASRGVAADDSELMNVAPSPVVTRARKDSYSLFPSQREAFETKPKGAGILLPSTTYSPTGGNGHTALGGAMFEDLLPPPSIRISGAPRHNRDSSLVSSATVQIGLRVSNFSDVTHLEAPFFLSPERPFSPTRPDSSLAARPAYTHTSRDIGVAVSDDYRNSTRSPIRATVEMRQSEKPITLSPTVYSPNNTLSPTVYSPDKAVSPRAKANRKSIDSIPSSIGTPTADASYSVGTAEWI
ncbi:hypothetical protein TrVFT333_011326 [Trichoderma virens FT-333]|nr:hypothetical protein TrVFT333_011326 [Trichoderma virens FT-333]